MSTPKDRPVFYDPDNKRWPRVKAGVFLAALLVSAVLVVLVASVLLNPALETLSLPSARFLPHRNHTSPPLPKESLGLVDPRLAKLKHVLAKEIRAAKHTVPMLTPSTLACLDSFACRLFGVRRLNLPEAGPPLPGTGSSRPSSL